MAKPVTKRQNAAATAPPSFTPNGAGYNMHPHHNFIIMAFVLAVMIQIVVLYLRVIRVLKELQQLILKHYKDQQPEDQNQFMVDGIQATFEKDDPPAQHVTESSKSPQSIQVTDSMISFDQHDIKSIRRNKPTF